MNEQLNQPVVERQENSDKKTAQVKYQDDDRPIFATLFDIAAIVSIVLGIICATFFSEVDHVYHSATSPSLCI